MSSSFAKNSLPHLDAVEVAQRLYASVFAGPIPEALVERLCGALDLLEQRYTATEIEHTLSAIDRTRDIEALEMAARYKHKLPVLVAAIRLVISLGETVPENQNCFIGQPRNLIGALLQTVVHGLRSVFKFAKGAYLLGRLDHA